MTYAYIAAAGYDSWLAGSSHPRARRARAFTKPLLMPLLAGSLLVDERAKSSPLRTSTVVAEVFGWGGDLALMRPGTKAFALGAGSFGVGHVAYIAGFLRRRDAGASLRTDRRAQAIASLWVTTAPVLALAAAREERALGPAVAGYSGLLAAMATSAAQLDRRQPLSASRATTAGALLFLASDTLLGVRKFLWRSAPERVESVVMATYTAAQLLLARGAARTR
jgi:uncharacterized membrane protein YhhN